MMSMVAINNTRLKSYQMSNSRENKLLPLELWQQSPMEGTDWLGLGHRTILDWIPGAEGTIPSLGQIVEDGQLQLHPSHLEWIPQDATNLT